MADTKSSCTFGVHLAIKFLQTAHNIASGYRYTLEVDGLLGPKTIDTIRRYLTIQPGTPKLNEEILLNCCNGEQYIYYKANPNHKYFRGWFTRV
ncbi:putative peptidoglycan-binding domain-containing protein [Desulfocastanea catecholica]